MELVTTPAEATPDQKHAEAEAMIRIANVIAAELPAVTSGHWHEALSGTRRRLLEVAQLRGYRPSLGEVE